MPRPRLPLSVFLFTAPLLAGCAGLPAIVETTPPQPASVRNIPRGPCGTAIAEFETIIENDQKIGQLSSMSHSRIIAELAPARADCSAGRGREANRRLAEVRSRYGYRNN